MKKLLTIIFIIAISTLAYGVETLYPIDIIEIIDGDSIRCDIHGYKNTIYTNENVRLYSLDTAENKRTKDRLEKFAGKLTQRYVEERVIKSECYISYIKEGKFGRDIVKVFYTHRGKLVNLNKELNDLGLSKKFYGKVAKKEWSRQELFHMVAVINYSMLPEAYSIYHIEN